MDLISVVAERYIDFLSQYLENFQCDKNDLQMALNKSCLEGNLDMIQILVKHGANMDSISEESLKRVINKHHQNIDLILYLVNNCAYFKKLNNYQIHALNFPLELVEKLSEYEVNVNDWMFIYAIINNNLKLYKKLSIKANRHIYSNILALCNHHRSMDIMDYVIDSIYGNFSFDDVKTICSVLVEDRIDIFKKILNHVSDINSFIKNATAYACLSMNCDLIKLVLDLGADPNDNTLKMTLGLPLEIVIQNYKLVKLLLNYSAVPTLDILISACQKPKIFHLIYQAKEWSDNDLIYVLLDYSFNRYNFSIWKYLHNILADKLKTEHFKELINAFLDYREFDHFDYLIDYHSEVKILPLVEERYYGEEAAQYLYLKYGLERFYHSYQQQDRIDSSNNKN